jgi:peptidoglycan hydrolase CwlO-like protein
MTDTSIRLQSNMKTNLTENKYHGNKINKIELGRVTKVNYQSNSVGFFLLTTGENGERASADDTYSAMLPMSMAGRNNYGKPYGELTPVRVGDIILVGFVDDKTYRPIVIGIYPDEAIANELSRADRNEIDPSSLIDLATANATYKIYPDQTYNYHDGMGTRVLSFSGHSFFIINAEPTANSNIDHRGDDSNIPLDYKDMLSSYFSNSTLIEPLSDKAPEMLFKHQGIVGANGQPDTHELYLFIGNDGTYRVSSMKTDEPWRTYFEIKDSEIRLVRQKNSKFFGGIDTDTLNSSSIEIDDSGNITLRNHTNGLVVKSDGVYTLAGEQLVATKNVISDLIIDTLGNLGFGGANLFSKSTALANKFIDDRGSISNRQDAILSDYIDCLGNNAYYTYAYIENNASSKTLSLSLCVYDEDKNFIEGKITTGNKNLQIVTRALPINARYLRVSITDKTIPIMLSFGTDYSAYQPSYLDVKAYKDKAVTKTATTREDYLKAVAHAKDVLSDNILAMQNINDSVADSKLSTADKKLLSTYLAECTINYNEDSKEALKYEVNTEQYKKMYNQLLASISPIVEDLSVGTEVTGSQVISSFQAYYDERYNVVNRIGEAVQALYNSAINTAESATNQQSDSMLKQFTNVTQSLQEIAQSTLWTTVTDDIDLNNETRTENLLFKGNVIKNSPLQGNQYIQVFSTSISKADNSIGITQRVWGADSVTAYTRLLVNNSWSAWELDANNNNYNTELNNINNKLQDTNASINDLTTTTKDINNQIKESRVTLTDYKESNDRRVDKVESRVGVVENSLDVQNKAINTLNTDVSNLSSKLTELDNTVQTINNTVQTVSKNVATATTDISDLSKRIADTNTALSDIRSRLDKLEAK